jgi:dihydrofolate reductase
VRRLIINEFLSLDGVAHAPGGADEDRDGGFEHGGWHMPFMDDLAGRFVTAGIVEAGGFLLGRRTYQIFAAYWPTAPQEEAVIARPLNTMPKYVPSATLTEPLDWENSRLLRGDLTEAVTALLAEDGGDLHVIGSTQLVRGLLERDLVDELRLMIDPLMLGGGKRVFPNDGTFREWRLIGSQPTTTGAILATYGRP